MQSALKDDKFLICRQISQALTKDALERFLVAYFVCISLRQIGVVFGLPKSPKDRASGGPRKAGIP